VVLDGAPIERFFFCQAIVKEPMLVVEILVKEQYDGSAGDANYGRIGTG
jgi:hypothetical protein